MITLIVFCITWVACGGTSDAVRNFTEQQMAIAFIVFIASDLNLIWTALTGGRK